MMAFSIKKFIDYVECIYRENNSITKISARDIYNKYINAKNEVAILLINNKYIFRSLIDILSNKAIILTSEENGRIYIEKINYLNYKMCSGDEDLFFKDGIIYNSFFYDDYMYDYIYDKCYKNKIECHDSLIIKKIHNKIFLDYILIDEGNLFDSRMLNEKYQNEFDREFFLKSNNDRKKLLFSFWCVFDKIALMVDDIYDGDVKFMYYHDTDTYSFENCYFKDYFSQYSDNDFRMLFRKISENFVVFDNGNDDFDYENDDGITIYNLIPLDIDSFLEPLYSPKNHDRINNIYDMIEYYEYPISFDDIAESSDEEYFGDMPDKMKKSFYEKPFGKEYCDLTEEELEKYEKIMNKIR